jgi:hypothetical protein
VAVIFIVVFLKFFGLWFRALLSGAHIGVAGCRDVDPPGRAR